MIDPAIVDLGHHASVTAVGMGLLAAVVGVLTTAGYRWVSTRSPPAGMAVIVGLGAVSGYLTVRALRTGSVLEGVALDHQLSAGFLLVTVLLAATTATAGSRLGDRIACQILDLSRIDARGEAAATVRAARLAVDIDLPDTIETAEGYQPVEPATERALAGTTVRLPHGLPTTERRDRLEAHVEREYGVGYAAVEMDADGSVDRVLVGRRRSGLGSMLAPDTAAVAIRADPSPDASLGDPVAIFSTGPARRLVATATLRTTNGSIATVIVDDEFVDEFDGSERYRLVTRPDDPTDGYEFASTLRTVDETVTTIHVGEHSPLAGEFAGWLPGRVLVLDRDDELYPLPADNETLEGGDDLWVVAPPAELTAFDSTVDEAASTE